MLVRLEAVALSAPKCGDTTARVAPKNGGKGIRTPDFQLAKLALYQLSYAPERIGESRLLILDCKSESEIENRDPKLKKCRSRRSGTGVSHGLDKQKLNCALLEVL